MEDDQDLTIEPFGLADQNCKISYLANYDQGAAGIAIRNFDDNNYPAAPGGTWWQGGVIIDDDTNGGAIPLISEELIAYCFGLEVEDIYGLEQNGADAASYEEEDYIGFHFQINKDTGTFRAGDKISHEIKSKRDETAPTIELSSANSGFATDTFQVTVSFSETVSGFELNDIEVNNGEVSNFEGREDLYTFDFTPTADGLSTIDVREGAAQDAAGNLSEAASQFRIEIDKTKPTVELISANSGFATGTFKVTVIFSESVSGFELSDIEATNGEVSDLEGNGDTYTFDFTPSTDGLSTINVREGVAQDAAGNPNEAASEFGIAIDKTAPTVELSSAKSGFANDAHKITVRFSEHVSGFELSDIEVTNGEASNLEGNEDTYTFDFTPSTDGLSTINVREGVAQDAAGNPNEAASEFGIAIDKTAPTVELSSAKSGFANDALKITVRFSEHVSGFELSDIEVTNGEASNLEGNEDTYTFDFTPTTFGLSTINIQEGTVQDGAGNLSEAASQLVIKISEKTSPDKITPPDKIAPTVQLRSAISDFATGTFKVTVVFSEAVLGFELSDIEVTNGEASNLEGNGHTYIFNFTPESDGYSTINIREGAAQDAAGNLSKSASLLEIEIDKTAPLVELSSVVSGFAAGTFKVTVSFSESVSGFELSDIEVTNGEASNLEGNEDTYTFDFTPTTDGLSTINIREGVAQDAAGNLNEAANQFGIEIDKTAPTITIIGSNLVYTREFEIQFELSEAVTRLRVDDIFVSGAEKNKLVKNDDVYVLELTFELSSYEANISVNSGAVRDLAGNYNEATEVFRVKRLQTPSSTFGYHKGAIRDVIKKAELMSLKNTIQVNKRTLKSARLRFIKNRKESQQPSDGVDDPSDQYKESKFKAVVSRSNNRTVSNGEMIKRKASHQGKRNMITHGSFDTQHDHERGFTSASFAWIVAWEKMITKNRMVGFFIGNQARKSNISSEFAGNIRKFEASAGVYLVGALSENIFVESFASLALSKNKLMVSDGILDLKSDYMSSSIVAGTSISGLVERPMYSFIPAITVAYGRSQMGTIGLVGSAYGLIDPTLKLDAGYISNLSIELRPEIIHTLSRSYNRPIETTIRFAPYLLCDLNYGISLPNECRHGMEFSVYGRSRNSLTSFEGLVSYNGTGNSSSWGLRLGLNHKF
jgi:hypothetical protein